MITIQTNNVTTALRWGVDYMHQLEQNESNIIAPRGKRTVESPHPICTVYTRPTQRVLLVPTRDANPFFHFFEALWMLAGRRDVEFVSRLNKGMKDFSDDGQVFWAAYGYRWRNEFGFDQIRDVIATLKRDPDTRRAVIAMWNPNSDVGQVANGKDIPCNTHVYFKARHGKLNMMVCNRSNDMLWGAYGANAVHMSMLQEYIAGKLGLEVGVYRQVSDSFHVYLDEKGGELWAKLKEAMNQRGGEFMDHYGEAKARGLPTVAPWPMLSGDDGWDADLHLFMECATLDREVYSTDYATVFFRCVVAPMWRTWKTRLLSEALAIEATDWKRAATEWILRRQK